MKKNIIKLISFIIIFSFLLLQCQNVLHYRWSGDEALYTKNIDYANQPKDSVDVVCFGTSEIYAAYDPIITFYEEGITGYNFAISYRSAVTVYYQLLYALKYQKPRLVICDFASMYDDQLPGDAEALYRKVVDCMPDKSIKNQMIRTICKLDPQQSYLSWKFPVFRYHSMWSELDELNFTKDYVYDESYPLYMKGALLHDDSFSGDMYDIVPGLWSYTDTETQFSDVSIKYYDMIIEECQSRGIEVAAVIPPKINAASKYAARWDAMREYFDSRGVHYLNYNTYDQVKRLGVTFDEDYYDAGHLNVHGSIKFSKILANDLKKEFQFADHRGDNYYREMWEIPLSLFQESYALE